MGEEEEGDAQEPRRLLDQLNGVAEQRRRLQPMTGRVARRDGKQETSGMLTMAQRFGEPRKPTITTDDIRRMKQEVLLETRPRNQWLERPSEEESRAFARQLAAATATAVANMNDDDDGDDRASSRALANFPQQKLTTAPPLTLSPRRDEDSALGSEGSVSPSTAAAAARTSTTGNSSVPPPPPLPPQPVYTTLPFHPRQFSSPPQSLPVEAPAPKIQLFRTTETSRPVAPAQFPPLPSRILQKSTATTPPASVASPSPHPSESAPKSPQQQQQPGGGELLLKTSSYGSLPRVRQALSPRSPPPPPPLPPPQQQHQQQHQQHQQQHQQHQQQQQRQQQAQPQPQAPRVAWSALQGRLAAQEQAERDMIERLRRMKNAVTTDALRNGVSADSTCAECSRPLGGGDALLALGRLYHAHCLRCRQCQRSLADVEFGTDVSGRVFCSAHLPGSTAPKNDHFEPTYSNVRSGGHGDSGHYSQYSQPAIRRDDTICARCRRPIAPAPGATKHEHLLVDGRPHHIDCFTCEGCGLRLSVGGDDTWCYPLDGHLLCLRCHDRWSRSTRPAITDL